MKIKDIDKIRELVKPFIMHYRINDWGDEILLMQEQGFAFIRIYWYNDEDTSIYLEGLSVSEESQKQGIGTKLRLLSEEIGRLLSAQYSYLYALKNSWMHNWYIHNGYIECKENEDDTNMMWLKKRLIKDKDGK